MSTARQASSKFDRSLNAVQSDAVRMPALWIGVLALCCLIAIGVSGYLTYATMTSSKIAGCGGGSLFNCGHVTSSKWSVWMGIPVSVMAIGSYLALSTALLVAMLAGSVKVKRLAWTAVATFAISAGLAAVWFTGLQVFALKHLCSYCLVAHGCGIVAAAIAIWKIPQSTRLIKFAGPVAAAAMAVLITGQVSQPEPTKFRIETFESAPSITETFDAPFEAPFAAPSAISEEVSESPSAGTEIFEGPLASLFSVDRVFEVATWVRPATAMMILAAPVQSGGATKDGSGSKQKDGSTMADAGEKKAMAKKAMAKEAKAERRTVAINGGTIKLDIKQWPLDGSVDAKYAFVEMVDYNCPNCRKTYTAVAGAKKALNGDVAVIVLPIPLNIACNPTARTNSPIFAESCEIAKLAIAVWRVNPEQFPAFHQALFESENAMTFAQAMEKAKSMVDAEKLDAELATDIPSKYIASMVQLYERCGKGNVPKLMFPGTSIVGEFTSVESLVNVIKQQTK